MDATTLLIMALEPGAAALRQRRILPQSSTQGGVLGDDEYREALGSSSEFERTLLVGVAADVVVGKDDRCLSKAVFKETRIFGRSQ